MTHPQSRSANARAFAEAQTKRRGLLVKVGEAFTTEEACTAWRMTRRQVDGQLELMRTYRMIETSGPLKARIHTKVKE